MGKKKREHIVFDGLQRQKPSIPFAKVNTRLFHNTNDGKPFMRHPRGVKSMKKSMITKSGKRGDRYREYFDTPYLMGPNSIRLLDEVLEEYPLVFSKDQQVLDLGCGSGLTSLFIANETGATVYANDLWISEEENRQRFADWQMQDRLIPVHEDANQLSFAKEQFDAVISIDSYHYFAGKEGFFNEKILPFLKKGGIALIVVPGMKKQFDGRSEELLSAWLTDEAYMFQSADFWKRIIGTDERIEEVRTWELTAFDQPWQEWFLTGHEFALNDLSFYESLIKPYTAFVGIMVRKKAD